MTMNKFKPQRSGSRSRCNHHGDRRHSKHRDYSSSSDFSDDMYRVKHEAHCPLYSPSHSSSDSDSSCSSFEQEYYQNLRHKHDSSSKNRPRHRSRSPKVHGRKLPKNTPKTTQKTRPSSAQPSTKRGQKARVRSSSINQPSNAKRNQKMSDYKASSNSSSTSSSDSEHSLLCSNCKGNRRREEGRKGVSSDSSSCSSSDSCESYSKPRQSSLRESRRRRSPSSSTSSEISHDSSCPNYRPRRNAGQDIRASGNDIVPRRANPQMKHKPGCKYASRGSNGEGDQSMKPASKKIPPTQFIEHDKNCPYRNEARKSGKSNRNAMPPHSLGKPRKSSRRRSSSSSSSSGFEQDYRQKPIRKVSKPKSPPQQLKRKKSKPRAKGK